MSDKIKSLTVEESVRNIFLQEMKSIIYNCSGSAFIKFINLAVGIEYLGACLDNHDFVESKQSENRFNEALKKLFHKRYKPFTKSGAKIYLFKDFRCSFIHQLKPGKKIVVTHRDESKREGTEHLKELSDGRLVLVLEDLFDDFESACNTLFNLEKKKMLPTKKMKQDYIQYTSISNNK